MRFVRTVENISGLPIGYKEVEYLQSSGTQYINTGLSMPNGFRAKGCYEIVTLDSTGGIIGAFSNTSPYKRNFYDCTYGSGNRWLVGFGGDAYQYFGAAVVNTKYIFNICNVIGKEHLETNGTEYTISMSGTAGTKVNYNLFLFALNVDNNPNHYAKIKLYNIKVYDENDVLIRDYVPCLDPTDTPCMYDLIDKKPYYNAGSGNFSYGRKIIPVEYIRTTGNQGINTGYKPNNNTKVETKIKMNESPSNFRWVFLARNQTVAGDGYGFGCNSSGNITSDYNNRVSATQKLVSGTTYNIYKNKNICKINDIILTNNISEFTVNYDLYLFAINDHGSISTSGITPYLDCYYFKMWDNNTLIRDFIPCKDENNVGYMFDRISHTCYLNVGSNAFIVGENKYTSKLRLIKDAKELPDGYKRVEYLESVGGQLIDTGYNINTATDEVICNFQLISTTLYYWLMGEHDNNARFGIGVGDGANKRNIAYGATTYKVNDTQVYNNRHVFTANSNGVYLDGVQVHGFESFTSTSTVYLFNLNISGGGNGASGKIWSYKHKRNGVLIRDFVPCLDKNNVPCMVDLVSGGTYYNQGTGSFSYGHIITPVEYLESSGTQYIDTGVVAKSGISSILDFEYTSIADTSSMLDARSGNNRFYLCHAGKPSNTFYFYYGYGSAIQSSVTPEVNTRYLVETKLLEGSQNMNVDRTTIASGSDSTNYNLGVNLYLFGMNYSTPQYLTSAKLYSCKILDGNVLVRSFIPVRDENNVGYMFDEVTGQLFGNAGSGSFGVGNDLPKPKVRFIQDVIPNTYLPLKYLQSTGTQYIDTDVVGKTGISIRVKASTTTLSDNNLIGSTLGVSGNYTRFFMTYFSNKIRVGYGGYSDASSISSGVAYDFLYETNSTSQKLYINGVESYTGSSTTNINTGLSMYLFGRRSVVNGSELESKYLMSGKIYYCQIWDNGVPVRDLYPALRKSDNKPGMYDRITKQFFVNQGTGEFNYG